MKKLVGMLVLSSLAAFAEQPKVTDCFKVNSLIRMDEDHYWANWTNSCPYTIESVYVMVGFVNKFKEMVGKGVWALHYIDPGVWRVTRLSTPPSVSDYVSVSIRKITTDSEEALHEALH